MRRSPYEVRELAEGDFDEWNHLVRTATAGTPFHRSECLELFAAESATHVRPLVAKNGREPIGLFPVFERDYPLVSAVFSPPPNLKVPYLGPVLLDHDASGNTAERRQWRFVRSCLDHIRSRMDPRYVHVRTTHGYQDPRPFDWEGFDVRTSFTYVVGLPADADRLFERFSSDVRSNVRDCRDADVVIEIEGSKGIRRIVEQVRSRLLGREESYPLDAPFIEALYERLPDGVVRPYVCRLDGEFVGGNVVLASGDTMYPWVGAATPTCDLGINDAVHWQAMQDGIDAAETRYDLVGADSERLSTYKSKFAPQLEPVYSLRKRTCGMRVVEQLYDHVA